jgi:hypothetical protein
VPHRESQGRVVVSLFRDGGETDLLDAETRDDGSERKRRDPLDRDGETASFGGRDLRRSGAEQAGLVQAAARDDLVESRGADDEKAPGQRQGTDEPEGVFENVEASGAGAPEAFNGAHGISRSGCQGS